MSARPAWLVLADPLSTRVLVEAGVVDRLAAALGERLQLAFLLPREAARPWAERLPASARPPLFVDDLFPVRVPRLERALRRADIWLDRRIGYYPLAIRLNYRHGLHLERMRPGHRNELLDSLARRPVAPPSGVDRGWTAGTSRPAATSRAGW